MIRIAKTGSTSIVRGLLGGIENASHLTQGVFPNEWRSLYSFGFVRNPYDRLVSAWLMFQGYATATEEEKVFQAGLTLQRVMEVVENPEVSPVGNSYRSKLKLHCLPMTAPFFHLDQATEIYRFENYPEEYQRLAHQLGVPAGDVPHWRKSIRQPHQSYYTTRDRRRAEQLFQADLEAFGYEFNPSARRGSRVFTFFGLPRPRQFAAEPVLVPSASDGANALIPTSG